MLVVTAAAAARRWWDDFAQAVKVARQKGRLYSAVPNTVEALPNIFHFATRSLAIAVLAHNSWTQGQSVPDYARPYGPWSLTPAAKGFSRYKGFGH
jgi:hypothetical protein